MGEILLKYYKAMDDSLGLQGKIRLAQETKLPSQRAALAPDTVGNVKLFQDAFQKISGTPAPKF